MQFQELRTLLRQRPFQPFRVYLKDERSFEIRSPEINLVTPSTLVIGIPVPNDPDPVADRFINIPIEVVSRIELLPGTAAVHSSR